MEIYILRHGIAEEGRAGFPDAERVLTDTGREKLQAVLGRAHAAGVKPSLILTSPYRRASQTARIAGHMLGCNQIAETEALQPGSTPGAAWQAIRDHRSQDSLLLAGHEPLLSSTVAFLLGVRELRLDFKKAGLVRIDLDSFSGNPHGVLKWMLTPGLV